MDARNGDRFCGWTALHSASQSGDLNAVEFVEGLYEPFYGGREFGIRDPNGYELYFMQQS